MKKTTRVTHPPEVPVPPDNRPLVAPIYQSVKFTFDDVAETQKHGLGQRAGYYYSRISNPTLHQLEATLCELQERDACLLTASGIASVTVAMLALLKHGDHVVYFAEMYQPTRAFIRRVLRRYGVASTMLSIDDMDALERLLESTPTRLVVFETPTNPVLKVADLPRICALARAHGCLTLLDNTLAGPHAHGRFEVDLFAHSLTKYASGHGDVMGGAVLGRRELIERMKPDFSVMGSTLDPHSAYLVQRGLRTYFARRKEQCASAQRIAEHLAGDARAERVRFPGLPTDPGHARAREQMDDFGTIVCFDVAGGLDAAIRFSESLELFAIAASLGSTESLVMPSPMLASREFDEQQRAWSDIGPGTVRLSIGLEDVDDLIADLDRALAAAAAGG